MSNDLGHKKKNEEHPAVRLVGKVLDAHSLGGELYVHLFAGQADYLPHLKRVWLEKSAERAVGAPYTVVFAKPHKQGLRLKVEGVADRTQAEDLRKSYLYIDADLLVAAAGESIYLGQLMGFAVFDGGQKIGEVVGFSSNGPQDLLVINKSGRRADGQTGRQVQDRAAGSGAGAGPDFEVPLVEAFLEKIDFEQKQILMNLPEGLVPSDEQL